MVWWQGLRLGSAVSSALCSASTPPPAIAGTGSSSLRTLLEAPLYFGVSPAAVAWDPRGRRLAGSATAALTLVFLTTAALPSCQYWSGCQAARRHVTGTCNM